MYNRIILTAGVSILGNINGIASSSDKRVVELVREIFSYKDLSDEERDSLKERAKPLLRSFIRNHEEEIAGLSAEISIIHLLEKADRFKKGSPVILFFTDTFDGKLAAELVSWTLDNYYDSAVSLHKLAQIDIHNRSTLNRALGNYLRKLSNELSAYDPRYTCFAPIGGYKILTSLGHLIGSLHGYATNYLYENSKVFHEIPSVKISFDESVIFDHASFFKRLVQDLFIPLRDLSFHERELLKSQSSLFEILEEGESEVVALSPFGEYLSSKPEYESLFEPKVYMDRRVKENIDRNYMSNWDDLLKNLRNLKKAYEEGADKAENRAMLYHESDFVELNDLSLKYHLFKGESKPKVIRAIWRYKDLERAYYIAYVWFDHDDYERQAVERIQAVEEREDWVDLSDRIYQK